jgi:hypothetical protein
MYVPKHLTDKKKADWIRACAAKMEHKAERLLGEARGMRQAADAIERATKAKPARISLQPPT